MSLPENTRPPAPPSAAGGEVRAGWYPDPDDVPEMLRYWDGGQWTEHTHVREVSAAEPTPAPAQPAPNLSPGPGPTTSRSDHRVHRRALRTLSGWLQGLLWACAAAGAAVALTGFNAASLAQGVKDGTARPFEVFDAEEVLVSATGFWFLVYGITAVVWIVWLWRTHRQVEAATGYASRYGQGWTIGVWFVPIVNLFGPKQIHDDLHRACQLQGVRRVPASFHWWWAIWLLTLAAGAGASGSWIPEEGLSVDGLIGYYSLSGARGVLSIVAAILAVLVVRELTSDADIAADRSGFPE